MNQKYFKYLYHHRHLAPRTISKGILKTFNKIDKHDIFTRFIFFIYFKDINDKIFCPDLFLKLCKSEKIINCIKEDLFHKSSFSFNMKDLPTNFKHKFISNSDFSQEEAFQIFIFLLNIEISIHKLYLSDIDMICKIISNMNLETKTKILNLNYKISPLICLLLMNIKDDSFLNSSYLSFYYFLNALDMDFRNALTFLNSKNLEYKKVEKILLYSKYSVINEYHKIFINFYPEIIYNCKINLQRLEYLNNPLCIPLEYSTLKNYLFCVPYFLKIMNLKLNDPNFDILIRVIYIEKIFKIGLTKRWCKLIHLLILDNCNILYVLLKRKFDIKNIKLLIKCVPSFHLAFDHSVKMYKETKDEFYEILLSRLLRKYPIKEYFKKILPYKEIFPSEFQNKFERYLNNEECLEH
ncbi:uncharacterized protein VNE69_01327 [Vairimorpha necatrix]|uniref:Uncharacterized protein n=1 Tax=Vairimorpha necatrix TaxID=6039 RepID=A0AAX4J8S9_9MICR